MVQRRNINLIVIWIVLKAKEWLCNMKRYSMVTYMYLLYCMVNLHWKVTSFGVILSAKWVMYQLYHLYLAYLSPSNMTGLSQSQYWIELSGAFTPLVVSSASVARLHGDFTSVYILEHFQISCIFCQPLKLYTSD